MTFESRERMSVRKESPRIFAWCEECGDDVWMVTPAEAALMAETDVREVFRGVEGRTIHFVESEQGRLVICAKSLESMSRATRG
ncbi:MAG TPA: hypothetical protein VFU37_11325 [Pyrinomonadaceae bacterium]|nr:hypothetical protein [Pyrinomonadaceae bacterium]